MTLQRHEALRFARPFKALPAALAIAMTLLSRPSAGVDVPPEAAHPPEVVALNRFERIAPHPRLMLNAASWQALRKQIVDDPRSTEL